MMRRFLDGYNPLERSAHDLSAFIALLVLLLVLLLRNSATGNTRSWHGEHPSRWLGRELCFIPFYVHHRLN